MKQEFSIEAVIKAVKLVVKCDQAVPLHEPCFQGNEWTYLKDCLDSGWVSSVGQYVDRFEKMLSEYTGAACAVAAVNGTAALHICLLMAGVTNGDEVLVPDLTFIATANAVSYCGAIPHLLDSEEKTLGIDPARLYDYLRDIAVIRSGKCINRHTGRRIKAVVPMHTFGHPVDMDPLLETAARYKLTLVEDAAESLGSLYKGRHTGTMGAMGVLSFNGNKTITTGGGGAILTSDQHLGRLAKHLTTTAKKPHRWAFNHDMVGYNYRMPNINAALGCAQMEQLPGFIKKKRNLAHLYQEEFAEVSGIKCFKEPEFACSNYWLNVLLLSTKYSGKRDELLDALNRAGFMSRPAWTLLHRLPMYQNCPCMELTIAEGLEQRLINIPSSSNLEDVYE
ncbi:MAG: LegC family aminotransferase [Syntrophomonadaceae bacterium]